MIIATIWKFGLHLPDLNLRAFSSRYLNLTLGGYSRLLALMTGIEVFANLVAAYEGTPEQRSRKAFRSLLIVMGTTCVTMLIVGPAILKLSDPTNPQVSVFTQTMDRLLPQPLPYLGTLIGIVVLGSAAAASAQGLQNLALGLRYRHYIPARMGQRNQFDVADRPVWVEVAIVSACYIVFGTQGRDLSLALCSGSVCPPEHDGLGRGQAHCPAATSAILLSPYVGTLRHDHCCAAHLRGHGHHFCGAFHAGGLGLFPL